MRLFVLFILPVVSRNFVPLTSIFAYVYVSNINCNKKFTTLSLLQKIHTVTMDEKLTPQKLLFQYWQNISSWGVTALERSRHSMYLITLTFARRSACELNCLRRSLFYALYCQFTILSTVAF